MLPRAIDAAFGRANFQVFGEDYDTPDGTCLRDFVHVTDLASAHMLSLDALRNGATSTIYNLGNGRPTSVRDILTSIERVTGRRVPYTPDPAATAIRRCSTPAAIASAASSAGRPQFEDVDTIVETAWKWRERNPQGYSSR